MPLTQQQWGKVTSNTLGLRAAKSRSDLAGAAFGLDDLVTGLDRLRNPPATWDAKLTATLQWMVGFAQTHNRTHLLLLKGTPGTTRDYNGTFPKCHSAVNATVLDSTQFSGGVQSLFQWVYNHL